MDLGIPGGCCSGPGMMVGERENFDRERNRDARA